MKLVWCNDFSWVNQFEAAQGDFLDLVGRLMSRPQVMELFATTAWHIWLHRNKTRLGEHTVVLGMIRDATCKFLQIFQQSRDYPFSKKPTKSRRQQRWMPPKLGEYKINFDGAMFNESEEAGIGVVVRNSSG